MNSVTEKSAIRVNRKPDEGSVRREKEGEELSREQHKEFYKYYYLCSGAECAPMIGKKQLVRRSGIGHGRSYSQGTEMGHWPDCPNGWSILISWRAKFCLAIGVHANLLRPRQLQKIYLVGPSSFVLRHGTRFWT